MYYVFIGQLNTTSGKPHKITGRYNIYGDLMAFDTLSDRDNFCVHVSSNNPYVSIVKTNRRDAKSKYFAGLTKNQYDDYLYCVDANAPRYSQYNLTRGDYAQ